MSTENWKPRYELVQYQQTFLLRLVGWANQMEGQIPPQIPLGSFLGVEGHTMDPELAIDIRSSIPMHQSIIQNLSPTSEWIPPSERDQSHEDYLWQLARMDERARPKDDEDESDESTDESDMALDLEVDGVKGWIYASMGEWFISVGPFSTMSRARYSMNFPLAKDAVTKYPQWVLENDIGELHAKVGPIPTMAEAFIEFDKVTEGHSVSCPLGTWTGGEPEKGLSYGMKPGEKRTGDAVWRPCGLPAHAKLHDDVDVTSESHVELDPDVWDIGDILGAGR